MFLFSFVVSSGFQSSFRNTDTCLAEKLKQFYKPFVMKKLFSAMALFTLLLSCNNAGNDGPVTDSTSINNTPSAIDTTQHPNGITNGSVISTDTASMNVENMRTPDQDSASR